MKVKAVVDKIEEGYYAVLLVGEDEYEVDWPYDYLPPGVQEGDILEFGVGIDKDGTDKQKEIVIKLLQKIKEKNISK
ncbi:MAG: hypothetical protein APF76_04665 [Desulfitibacter sp. BRH_c19]|nr:MAG: hypothetical protein APF76_04665 [Desulfitibacter sp. BRH_c19]